MKNILISGYYGFGNIGDEAILSAMIKQIKTKILDCNLIVTSYNVEETKRLHEVEAIDRLDFNAISQQIENCDLVILGGGGLFQDYHGIKIADIFTQPGWGISSYAIVPLIAKMHNKPVLYYSLGIGPLFSTESRTFVAFASELADMITVRDKASEDLLREVGVPSAKIKLGLDPAVGLEIASEEKIKNILMSEEIPLDKEIVCVSVRQWIDKSLEENYKKALSGALDDFLSNNKFYLLFLPFQNMEGGGEDAKIAEEIIEGIRNKDRCYLLRGSYHPREIVGIISKASLVIGMRYHSIIFSLISKVPFVALSYDSKVKNLVDELELGEYCIEIDAITSEDVSERIIKALTDREKIQIKLESALKEMRERLEVSSGLVQAFVEGHVISDVKTDITDITDILSKIERKKLVNLRMVAGLEKQLKDKNAEVVDLQETVAGLESQIEIKNQEIGQLQETLRQRESSLSWRFSQFYGRYFSMDSPLTRFISYILNKIVHSLEHRNVAKTKETKYYKQELESILKNHEGKVKGIVVYPSNVDWNIPLFQRPQQIALKLSDLGYLFFFSTVNGGYDKIDGFYKVKDNCYITNQYDLLVKELPDFIFMPSSPNLVIRLEDVLKIKDKALIIYEYIDEIHQDITGPLSIDCLHRHEYMIKNSDIVVATSDKLLDDVTKIRKKGVYLIPNGVEYEHFHIQRDYDDIPSDIKSIIKKGNPIIGYHGALAKWFDYELVKEMAKKRPNYEIVLIGWDYDGSIRNQRLKRFKNIHYLGIKKYPILPKYAVWFDVATIPFVLNKITESASPIKIFEYMALGKPIVTTDLRECRKYKSVLIGKDYEDFIEKVDKALELRDDPAYLELLDKEAKENTWEDRARKIDEAIQEHFNLSSDILNYKK